MTQAIKSLKNSNKLKKQITPYVIGLLLALLPVAFLMLRNPGQVEAGWYNDNWIYRQKIVFGNSGSAVTNQKVLIEIDTGTLISSGYMQSDCGDVRFTNAGGKVLPHYLDSGAGACNTASTDYYVLFEDIVAGDNLSYIYYGNPNALDAGEGSNFTQSTFSPSTSPTTATQETGPGPVGHWSFDEGADNTCEGGTNDICDSTQFANDGSLNGTATWQSSEFCITDNCLYFDGDGDYANIPDSEELDLTQNMTLSAWVKMNSLGTGTTENRVFFKGSGAHPSNLFTLDIDESNILFTTFGDNPPNIDPCSNSVDLCARGETDLETNTWYHIAATYDGSVYKVYLNGVLDGSHSNAGRSGSANSDPIYIGGRPDNSDMFTGFIDGVKIYPYARSAAEIATDYHQMSGVTGSSAVLGAQDQRFLSDGLVGYWSMEDNVSGDAQTISDQSGNDNDGTTEDSDSTLDCTIIGKFGFGCDFEGDGGDDVINFGDIDLDGQSASFTLSAWINVDDFSADEGAIFSKWQADNNRWTFNYTTSGGLFFSKDENDGNECDGTTCNKTTQSGVLTSNNWYHVAAVYNTLDKDLTMYVNGEEQNLSENEAFLVGPGGNSLGGGSDDFKIGRRADGNDEFNGTIDEARVYTRALSSNEVKSLYNWAPEPVAYYPLDENTGSTTYDRSSSGSVGTFNNDPTWVSGKFGSGLNFDTDNQGVNFSPAQATTRFGTASVWFKTNKDYSSGGEGTLFYTCDSPCDNGFGAQDELHLNISDTNTLEFFIEGTSGGGGDLNLSGSTTVNDGEWHHASVTWESSGNVLLYLNGVLETSATHTANLFVGDTELIGKTYGNSREFEGVIDDVRVYNYARTQSQIIEDMNGGHPVGGSPVGSQRNYWAFDEGYGDIANDNLQNDNGDLGGSGNTCPGGSSCPDWTSSGKVGGALDFELSDNDYIDFGDVDLTTDFTITAWLKPESLASDEGVILSKWNDDDGRWAFRITTGGALEFITGGASQCGGFCSEDSTTGAVTLGNWNHAALTFDATTYDVEFYVNGYLLAKDTDADLGALTSGDDTLRSGRRADSNDNLDGLLDELKIYNTKLTQEQILIDMNANASSSYGVLGSTEKEGLVDGEGSGPVAYYSFNENTGTTSVYDRSGNGLSGTINGSKLEEDWVQGPKGYGSALKFDGANDNVQVSDDDSLDLVDDWTISGWAKTYNSSLNTDWDFILSKGNIFGGQNVPYGIKLGYNQLRVNIINDYDNTTPSVTVSSLIDTNEWFHFAAVNDDAADSVYFYINGAYAGSDNVLYESVANSVDFKIGSSTGNWWNGELDEIYVYDYQRTASQIAYEYNRGAPIAHWQFDECQGSVAYDASGNGNNGTIVAGAGTNTSVGTCSSGNGDEMWDNGTNGKFNASLDLDGTDDYISVSSDNLPTTEFTYSLWVYPNNIGDSQVLFQIPNDADSGNSELQIQMTSTGALRYVSNGGTVNGGAGALTEGEWNHVALAVGDTSDEHIFINGEVVGIHSGAANHEYNGCPLNIGRGVSDCTTSDYWYFNGLIDDVRIYNYQLSKEQIETIMNEGASVRYGPATGSP